MRIKTHFHINGFALSLALKQRLGGTRKWAIGNSNQSLINKSKSGQKLPSNSDAVRPTTVVVTKVRVLNHRYDKL